MFGDTRVIELLVVDDSTRFSSIILGRDTFNIFELGIAKQFEKSVGKREFPVNDNSVNFIMDPIMNIEVDKIEITDYFKINPEIPFNYQRELEKIFKKDLLRNSKSRKPRQSFL